MKAYPSVIALFLAATAARGSERVEPPPAISGIVTTREGHPVPRASVYTIDGPSYGYAVSKSDGSFRMEGLAPGAYTLAFWREGMEDRRIAQVPTGGAPLRVEVKLLPPRVELSTGRSVFRPGELVEVGLRAFRGERARLEVYALSKETVIDREGRFVAPRGVSAGAKAIHVETRTIRYRHPFSTRHDRVALPIREPGAYLVKVGGPGGPRTVPIVISDLGLIVKRSPGEVLVWAVHLGTGDPYIGASVRLAGARGRVAEGATDGDGLFRHAAAASESLTVTAEDGPHMASVSAPLAAGAMGSLKGYIYTDRPVYRPGQHVFYKAILRRETPDGHAVPSGEAVTVRVRDALGQVIQQGPSVLSEMGTITGNIELATEPPLGMYSVEVDVAGETATGSFKVYEYRKPEFVVEVAPDRERYSPGETVTATLRARYHFGAPLSGVAASWLVFATPYIAESDSYEWGGEDYDAGYGRLVASGAATLHADGSATVTFVVPELPFGDARLAIEAVVTDASNRSVTGRASAIASQAEFHLEVRSSSWVVSPGSPVGIVARAAGFDGAPVATSVSLEIRRRIWSSQERRYTDGVALQGFVGTGAEGVGTLQTPSLSEGYYVVIASARDTRGRAVTARSWFWVAGRDFGGSTEELGALEVVLDKGSYLPGETARALVHGIPADGAVLVTVERDAIVSTAVRRASGSVLVLDVPLTDDEAPNVYLAISTVRQGKHRVRAVPVKVSSMSRALAVEVTGDRPSYRPGDRATVDLRVTDGYGRPVAAEVSLGVVDEAIYGISEELAPDIYRFFHGMRPNRVATVYSFSERLLGGADKDGKARVRRNFKDTAFWAPALRTDATGHARVSFDWPDNLTTWRFTARAVTLGTAVGSAVTKTLVTQELVTRIHAPRFFVAGDVARIDVVVNDRSGRERRLEVRLEVEGAGRIEEPARQQRSLAASGEARFSWTLVVGAAGAVRLRAHVRDEAKASARLEDNQDAMETTLPVLPFGKPFTVIANGEVGEGGSHEVSLSIPEGAIPESLSSTIKLDQGLASAAFGSLEDLIGYPYGCAEQTMSRFLPTVVASEVALEMGGSLGPRAAEIPKMVAQGTSRLYGYQHADGGWGWWKDDPTHPYMTAYVTWGLWLARKAGFPVDSERIDRGLAATVAQLASAETPDAKAFMLHALAEAGRAGRNDAIALFAERARLSDYGRGLLLSVLASLGERERAAVLRQELEARANLGGARPEAASGAHWKAETWNEGWMENPIEATAYALRGLVAADPGSPTASLAARWLALHRRGTSWHSTKDSAAAVMSLLHYARAREPRPDARVRVALDRKKVHELRFQGFADLATLRPLDLPAKRLRPGHHRLTVEREGQGRIFYSARVAGVVATEAIAPEGTTLRIERRYFVADQVPDGPGRIRIDRRPLVGPVAAGTTLQCELTVDAGEEVEFVMVEDPLPAGFEIVADPASARPPCDDCVEALPYDRREERDEKIAFFKTKLTKGVWTLTYLLKAETPGRFRVLPSRAEAMYTPGVEGHGASAEVEVLP